MVIFILRSLPGLHTHTAWTIISALIKSPIAWKSLNALNYFMLFIRIAFQIELTW